jgi:hypothetical protein
VTVKVRGIVRVIVIVLVRVLVLAKVTVSLPMTLLLVSAITELFDEDLPEEDKLEDIFQRAIDWYRTITMIDDNDWKPITWFKEYVFPQYSILTNENVDATAKERFASLAGKSAKDLFQENIGNIIPSTSYGALRGMIPVRAAEALAASGAYDTSKKFIMGEDEARTYAELSRTTSNQQRIFDNMFASPAAPIESVANMKNLLLNYIAPKDGKDGIDTLDFGWGLITAGVGSREARQNLPKRYEKLGGWGY